MSILPSMRTTLRLADDVYRAVKGMAKAEDRSLGEVASELIRRGLRQEARVRFAQRFPMFDVAEDSPPIALETVRQAFDDEPWSDGDAVPVRGASRELGRRRPGAPR
jgi:predicted CopG family antitoxin